jgi:hypothetical protein
MIEEQSLCCKMARPTEWLVKLKVYPCDLCVLYGQDFLCHARLTPLFARTYS